MVAITGFTAKHTTSSSMMLWPHGSKTAAVADLINVSYDEAANTISVDVDIVDKAPAITEFKLHQHQTLDVDAAHYYFNTRPGIDIDIDAPALLQTLKAADYKVSDTLTALLLQSSCLHNMGHANVTEAKGRVCVSLT